MWRIILGKAPTRHDGGTLVKAVGEILDQVARASRTARSGRIDDKDSHGRWRPVMMVAPSSGRSCIMEETAEKYGLGARTGPTWHPKSSPNSRD